MTIVNPQKNEDKMIEEKAFKGKLEALKRRIGHLYEIIPSLKRRDGYLWLFEVNYIRI